MLNYTELLTGRRGHCFGVIRGYEEQVVQVELTGGAQDGQMLRLPRAIIMQSDEDAGEEWKRNEPRP